MPMKLKAFLVAAVLVLPCFLRAEPTFWNVENATPTPLPAPDIQAVEESPSVLTATPTPVLAPAVEVPTATPTPRPGLKPVDPTQAALFSAVVPGLGDVYAGDPVKGLVFAALFGVCLWQTIDNLQLVPANTGNIPQNLTDNQNIAVNSKNETAGNLFGLATLAVYGFGIQDASNTATHYNKQNYLSFQFGIEPMPNARLAYAF